MRRFAIIAPLLTVMFVVAMVMSGIADPTKTGIGFTFAVAGTAWLFVITYGVIGKPLSTEEGRNLISFVAVIAALATYTCSVIIFGANYGNRDWIRIGSWSAVWLVVVRLYILMVRRQIQGRQRRKREKEDVR